MRNAWYDKALTRVGSGLLDLNALSNPKIIAIESGLYSFSQSHEYLSDVIASSRIATTAMASVVFGTVEGWLDAADVVFTSPTAAKEVVSLIIFEDTGVEATSPLLIFVDDANILPITTESGKDLEIAWQGTGIARL